MPRRPHPRAWLVLSLATILLACSFDEAEFFRPGTAVITAEPGQLRVLGYRDDPTRGDNWIDVVEPDAAVFAEGDSFRQDDGAHTATADEPADRRRLFTAIAPGHTLLVELNCTECDGGVPSTDVAATGLHVWDLVVDDAGAAFTDATAVADPAGPNVVAAGQHLVVVRPAADEAVTPVVAATGDDENAPPLRWVASHAPDDGAALWVDVFAATDVGDATVTYPGAGGTVAYAVTVT